jgi:tRNA threonylcarbamoyladenosine biosynthesis protein TsaE
VTRGREFDSAGAVPSSRWPADSPHRLAEGSAVSLTVSTADEMRELGRRLASAAAAGDLLILSGGLGAGKTTLTKGIGDGLGVRGPITSPTFVIARVHPPVGPALGGPGPSLVHADAYRLAEGLSADRLEIAIETLPMGGVDPADPDDLAGDMPRTVRITPVGQRWEGIELPLLGLADRL